MENLDKAENIIYGPRQDRHEKKKEDTDRSRILETDKRQTFISILQQNKNNKYLEHQLKISFFHCWYALFTG